MNAAESQSTAQESLYMDRPPRRSGLGPGGVGWGGGETEEGHGVSVWGDGSVWNIVLVHNIRNIQNAS